MKEKSIYQEMHDAGCMYFNGSIIFPKHIKKLKPSDIKKCVKIGEYK